MADFCFGDLAKSIRYRGEAFFVGYFGEVRVEKGPFEFFAFRCCFEVLCGAQSFACWVRCGYFCGSALQVVEEELSMFFFVVSSFLEDGADLFEAFFLCDAGGESVPAAAFSQPEE